MLELPAPPVSHRSGGGLGGITGGPLALPPAPHATLTSAITGTLPLVKGSSSGGGGSSGGGYMSTGLGGIVGGSQVYCAHCSTASCFYVLVAVFRAFLYPVGHEG
jgi:hypothetical protein